MQVKVTAEILTVENGYVVTITRYTQTTSVFTCLASALTYIAKELLGQRYEVELRGI